MRFLADYFPLLLFFVAFKWQGIWVATAVAIAASILQIIWFHLRGTVSAVHWLSLAVIVVFGGASCCARSASTTVPFGICLARRSAWPFSWRSSCSYL